MLEFNLWQTTTPDFGINGRAYLRADPQRVADMQRRRLPAGRRIGLSWRTPNDWRRFELAWDFLPAVPNGAVAISLQKDLRDNERPRVFDGGALFNDFAGSAALMSCLDALVTVDTANAHLGGALGVKTAVVLPYSADWRWGLGDTTPWYSSARLFRQPDIGQWAPALVAASRWCVMATEPLGGAAHTEEEDAARNAETA